MTPIEITCTHGKAHPVCLYMKNKKQQPLSHQSATVQSFSLPQTNYPAVFVNPSPRGSIGCDTCGNIGICNLVSLYVTTGSVDTSLNNTQLFCYLKRDAEGERQSVMQKYVPFPLWSAGPRRLLFVQRGLYWLRGLLHLRLEASL